MRFLGLAILWLFTCAFLTSIGVILTATVLTTIAMLDFVHEFVFYGASTLTGAFIGPSIFEYCLKDHPFTCILSHVARSELSPNDSLDKNPTMWFPQSQGSKG